MIQKSPTIALETLQSLLDQAGLSKDKMSVQHFETGGNNMLFHVATDTQHFALKKYQISKEDQRDRLGTEWGFLSVLQKEMPVPKPLAVDREKGLALYSFIEGRKLEATEIKISHIQQASDFVRKINAPEIRMQAKNLQPASEAAFSLQGQFDILKGRLELLQHPDLDDLKCEMQDMAQALYTFWKAHDIDLDAEIPPQHKVLSPSDFGFHNALANESDKLTFIDFEYAGWDDPAKLSSDFFFQPQIPVDPQYYAIFLENSLAHIPQEHQPYHRQRAALLRPQFGLRWCCIILNPFGPTWAHKQDRSFSGDTLEKLRISRFNTAQSLLKRVHTMIEKVA